MRKRPTIQRLLLKVSGEVFGGEGSCIDLDGVERFAGELRGAQETGAEIAVVVGGGNILRGDILYRRGIDRVSADYMGMLGTIINAEALQSALEVSGVDSVVMTSIAIEQLAEPFTRRRALEHLESGRLVILAGGTGNPYFTTDTAAALRAAEIKADVLIKGTKVDGIYSSDPVKNPDAEMLEDLSYTEVLRDNLRVMDATAVALCREHRIPIIVFNLFREGNLKRILEGEALGTLVQ
jgi:uridylate kinase